MFSGSMKFSLKVATTGRDVSGYDNSVLQHMVKRVMSGSRHDMLISEKYLKGR